MLAPTAAERARSALARASVALLRTPGAAPVEVASFGVEPDGGLLLVLPTDADAHCPHQPTVAVVEATDRCPLPLADRVRGRVWVAGMLHAVDRSDLAPCADLVAAQRPTGALLGLGDTHRLLRVEPLTIQLVRGPASIAAAVTVDWAAYATAEPDLLVADEAALLAHLVDAHLPDLRRICSLLEPAPAAADALLTPVLIDRYGVVVRLRTFSVAAGRPAVRDARVAFTRRLDDVDEIGDRFVELLGLATVGAQAPLP